MTNHRPNHSQLTLLFLLVGLFLLLSGGGQAAFGEEKKIETTGSLLEVQYKTAKDFYHRLEHDDQFGSKRKNWLSGVRNFRKLYLFSAKNQLTPACLYMMAKMNYQMYLRFQKPIDLEEAIIYYKDVAKIFPKSNLADDALFRTAEIFLLSKKDPQQAANFYRKLISHFPNSDKQAQANSRLQELSQDHKILPPEDIDNDGFSKNLVNVLPVKYWSSDEYTRIVIRASEPVKYTTNLLEKNGDQPRRLYIDFALSYIPQKLRSPIPIQDGLLKQIRTGQFDQTTVRVVLDIQSISNYKVFSLNDPFRVVIDVHGAETKPVVAKDPSPGAAPQIPTFVPKDHRAPQNFQAKIPQPLSNTPVGKARVTPLDSVPDQLISLRDDKKRKPIPTSLRPQPGSELKLSLAQQLGLGVKRIVIDPGHGGKDPGAMAFGMKEKDIALLVAQKVASYLTNQYGYEVILTRN